MLSIPEFKEYHQKCLSGEDLEFSEKYICKANSSPSPPIYYKEIFKK